MVLSFSAGNLPVSGARTPPYPWRTPSKTTPMEGKMPDQEINHLESRIFKLEQELIAASFRGDIAYRAISILSLKLKSDDSLQKLIVESINSLSLNPDLPEMNQGLFEAEKKHAISEILSVNDEK